jgi:hypothetical protein
MAIARTPTPHPRPLVTDLMGAGQRNVLWRETHRLQYDATIERVVPDVDPDH